MAKTRKKSNIKFWKKTQKYELPDLQPQKRRKICPVMILVVSIDIAKPYDDFQHLHNREVVNRLQF